MMTKKHFKAFAAILNGMRLHTEDRAYTNAVIETIIMCKKENPRFDAATFYDACGIDKDSTYGTLAVRKG